MICSWFLRRPTSRRPKQNLVKHTERCCRNKKMSLGHNKKSFNYLFKTQESRQAFFNRRLHISIFGMTSLVFQLITQSHPRQIFIEQSVNRPVKYKTTAAIQLQVLLWSKKDTFPICTWENHFLYMHTYWGGSNRSANFMKDAKGQQCFCWQDA